MQEETKKTVVLLGVNTKEIEHIVYSMEELKGLAFAANYDVKKSFIQKVEHSHFASYVGSGKLLEIGMYVKEQYIDVVICNDELSPLQIRKMEEVLDCELLDRTLLILHIFAERAKTKEAMLQIELARLQYLLPRLIGSQELDRQGGGNGGFKNRGAGETKLELDKRRIEAQIQKQKKALKQLVEDRQVARQKRKKRGKKIVALVGYTNAGKSTLMNQFLKKSHNEKEVYVKDMLFATLETKTRKIVLPHKHTIILTDTVGFVDKLPHALINAFRSTLEEVKEADILLHVIDYSNPFYEAQMRTTQSVLQALGASHLPIFNVFNKLDKISNVDPYTKNDSVFLSARKGQGISLLLEVMEKKLFGEIEILYAMIPYTKEKLLHQIHEHYEVVEENASVEGVHIAFYATMEERKLFETYIDKDH
ncbi:MAG: GTPase HflX [Breznakia sp.]